MHEALSSNFQMEEGRKGVREAGEEGLEEEGEEKEEDNPIIKG
jgi:hypothetical protein